MHHSNWVKPWFDCDLAKGRPVTSKKLATCAAVLFATLGLAACGSTADKGKSGSSKSDDNNSYVGGKGDYFGQDDRKDPFRSDVPDRHRKWARSTALLAEADDIVENDDGEGLKLESEKYSEDRDLCADARFADQPVVPNCSSFLVKPDVMVTAGHCTDWGFSCEDARFVFDYGYYQEGEDPTQIEQEDVYKCEEMIAEKYEGNELDELDYAVIKLQRPVEDREPLELRQEGHAQPGDHLALIGYPDGLPVKIDARGVVFHTTDTRFVATNDSFSGHSGSAVVNTATGKVEAVHVASGGDRFERDDDAGCMRAKQCQEANIDGECQGSIGVYTEHWRQYVDGNTNSGGDAGMGDAGMTSPDAGSYGDSGMSSDAGTYGDSYDDMNYPDTGGISDTETD